MPKYYDSSGARRPLVVGPRGIEAAKEKSRWDLFPSKIFNTESESCLVDQKRKRAKKEGNA